MNGPVRVLGVSGHSWLVYKEEGDPHWSILVPKRIGYFCFAAVQGGITISNPRPNNPTMRLPVVFVVVILMATSTGRLT